jgi:hypothetical protein
MKIRVNVPTSSAKNFWGRLYTICLREQMGAAAPVGGYKSCCKWPVSDKRRGFRD